MGKQVSKYLCLVIQIICFLALGTLLLFSYLSNPENSDFIFWKLLPVASHLLILLVAAILLGHYTRTTIGVDAQLLPFLFVFLSLTDLRICSSCFLEAHLLPLPLEPISQLYQISELYGSFLILQLVTLQSEINTKRIYQLMLITFASSIFFGIYVPISLTSPSFLEMGYITSTNLRILMYILGVLGTVTVIFSLLQGNLSKETILKYIAYILILVANTLSCVPYSRAIGITTLALLLVGCLILVLVARKNQIWG